MKSPRNITALFCIILAALSTSAFGETIEQLFEAALENDAQLKILSLALESRQIAIQRANLDQQFGVSAGTNSSKSGISYIHPLEGGDPALTIGGIYASVTLPEDIETTVRVEADVDFGLIDGVDPDFSPVFSISQPLNPLLGLEASKKGKLYSEAASLIGARMALWNRERAVKKSVVSKIKLVLGHQKSLGDAERAAQFAEEAIQRAKVLETYIEGSTESVALENTLLAAARGLDLQTARLALAAKELEAVVGRPVSELPELVPVAPLDASLSIDINLHPSVHSSRTNVEKAEIALEEHLEPYIPNYSVSASYTPDTDSHTIGASISTGFENFSLTPSVSVGIGDLSTQALSASIAVHWSLPDNRADNLITKELELAVETANLQHKATIATVTLELESLRLNIQSLEIQRANLAERAALEERILQDKAKRFELGAVGAKALKAAEWAFEKLTMDIAMLEYEALSISFDLQALQYTE